MPIDVLFIEPSNDGLAAGEFTCWLEEITAAINSHGELDVPCGECNACCRGAYFIHVAPADQPALEAIPEPLLFPAPGRDAGHRLMGFDENGHCPFSSNPIRRCLLYTSDAADD